MRLYISMLSAYNAWLNLAILAHCMMKCYAIALYWVVMTKGQKACLFQEKDCTLKKALEALQISEAAREQLKVRTTQFL